MGEATGQAKGAATEIVTAAGEESQRQVRGTVRVAPAVLIELIELTVRDVAGVVDLRPHRRRPQSQANGSASPNARSYDDGKVRVGVDGNQIDADVTVSVERGTNITELSHEIQQRVGVVAGQMLGMTVTAVNIYVEDIVGRESTDRP